MTTGEESESSEAGENDSRSHPSETRRSDQMAITSDMRRSHREVWGEISIIGLRRPEKGESEM
jgi:hypothetical protein